MNFGVNFQLQFMENETHTVEYKNVLNVINKLGVVEFGLTLIASMMVNETHTLD